MREKARDIFCRRELLASAAFHSLPHLFIICSLTLELVTLKRTCLFTAFFSCLFFSFWLGFRLISGMHTCSREESERLTLLTYIRDTPTSGPGELACFRSVLLHACTNCPVRLAVTYSLSEDKHPSTGKQKEKVCSAISQKRFFTLLISSVISVFSLLTLVWSLIAFRQP